MAGIKFRKRMTRKQFEDLFAGQWEEKNNGAFRKNGPFITRVQDGKKIWRNRQFAVTGKTWYQIAKVLKLVP